MTASNFYYISPQGKFTPMATVEEAIAAAKNAGFIWLNYCRPRKEELARLTDLLDFHPLAVEDCFDEKQIPKMDEFPQNTFFIFNAFDYADKKLRITEIDALIGNNFLVTVSQNDCGAHPVWNSVERLLKMEIERAKHGPGFLLHIILDQVLDNKFLAIEALEDELDAQEETLLANISAFNPGELIQLRRDLLNLRKSLFHEREILIKICRKDCRFISEKAIYHYRDIYDHLAKFFELTESYREIVATLMEMYLSMLNNEMTKAANATNKTVRRLTFITTIFMPLTLLAGIGGMSEWTMMTGAENWKISYPALMMGMLIIGVASYYLLKWIERKR
jgi:magnesium transporter